MKHGDSVNNQASKSSFNLTLVRCIRETFEHELCVYSEL